MLFLEKMATKATLKVSYNNWECENVDVSEDVSQNVTFDFKRRYIISMKTKDKVQLERPDGVITTYQTVEELIGGISFTSQKLVLCLKNAIFDFMDKCLAHDVIQRVVQLEYLYCLDMTGVELRQEYHHNLKFGNMVNLDTLILDDTNIRLVDSSIGQLQNLRVLSVQYNRLYDLPVTIRLLKNLTELNITGNLFRSIPGAVFHLQKLEKLDGLNENFLERYSGWKDGEVPIATIGPLKKLNPPREHVESLKNLSLHHAIGMNVWCIALPDQFREELIRKSVRNDLCEECLIPVRKIMDDQETNGYMIKVCMAIFMHTRNVPFRFMTCSVECRDRLVKRLTHLYREQTKHLTSRGMDDLPEVFLKEENFRPVRLRRVNASSKEAVTWNRSSTGYRCVVM